MAARPWLDSTMCILAGCRKILDVPKRDAGALNRAAANLFFRLQTWDRSFLRNSPAMAESFRADDRGGLA
jgi:hypothetical protein